MEGNDTITQLMAMAAITAPKTRRENFAMGIPLSVIGKSIYFDRR